MDSLGGVMSDLLEFLARAMFETVFSFGNTEGGCGLSNVIGCLGGSVIYAMTGKRVDLENDDWRSVVVGTAIIAALLTVVALGIVALVRGF